MNKYHYRALPNGNEFEFPEIVHYLKSQGVRLEQSKFPNAGAMFRWPVEDTPKMPKDNGEPYFGTEDSGHTIFSITDEAADKWVEGFRGGPWVLL